MCVPFTIPVRYGARPYAAHFSVFLVVPFVVPVLVPACVGPLCACVADVCTFRARVVCLVFRIFSCLRVYLRDSRILPNHLTRVLQ